MRISDENSFNREPGKGWFSGPNSYKKSSINSTKMKNGETSSFSKFRLLMWKNWLLQRRKMRQTILELFFSVIFCILLVIIRDLAPSPTISEPTVYQPFEISSLPSSLKPSRNSDLLASLYEYFFSSEEDSKKRKTREIKFQQNVTNSYEEREFSFFEKSKLLHLPKIQEFLTAYPSELPLIDKLINATEQWAVRRKKLHDKIAYRKRKRTKRFLSLDWFYDPAWPIAFTPNNTAVREIMGYVGEYLYLDTEKYGFDTEKEMVDQLVSYSVDPASEENAFFGLEDVLGGIVFVNDFPNDTFPDVVKYKIRLKGSPRSGKKVLSLAPPPRWNTELTYPVFQIPGPRDKKEEEGGDPGYYEEGFLAIQHAIDKGIADYMNGKEIDKIASLSMNRMPYPAYIDDAYLVALQAWLPLIILLSYLYPTVNIVRCVIYEKENKLKESMKMMGLVNWLHWTAWFIKSLMLLLVTSFLITVLLCTRWNGEGSVAVLDNSDPTVVFFFLFIYSCSAILFCFLISTIFSKANSGAMAFGIIWIFSYLPNIFLRPRFLSISFNVKICISLYFNTAMSLGCFLTSMFEGTGAGLQWHLLTSGVSPDSPFSIADVLMMMIVDSILYAVLTWYIEAVFPGEFGVPQPWNFPFKKYYWLGVYKITIPLDKLATTPSSSVYFEVEPVGLVPGIKVKGLTKVFAKQKIAVNNMYMNMYDNQITVLLGHNGAGKTTTMSMLTGLFPPSRGTAEVNGFDIVQEMKQVRNSIGICPQHDVLFDDLTVTEHIIFFSELKGLRKERVKEEVADILKGIKLTEKADAMAKTLSGGMKRKLSVGVALCAGSRVVILDEPTSGMDPGARRIIWDLLQKERNGRTILLTTHFMEEADLLGDRIAIMNEGVIQCFGSSMFLKKLYGAGYHLIMVKDQDCDVSKITDVITTHIPEAEIQLNVAAELSYVLPNEDVAKFEALFKELEERKDVLKISSYGASQTTMEEVFLRVGEANNPELKNFFHKDIVVKTKKANVTINERSEEEKGKLLIRVESRDHTEIRVEAANTKPKSASVNGINQIVTPNPRKVILQRNSGIKLILQQFWAMFVKKMLYSLRNRPMSLTQILVPVGFLIVAMVTLRNLPGVNDKPPSLLSSLNAFDGTESPIQDLYMSNSSKLFMKFYSSELQGRNERVVLQSEDNFNSYLLKKEWCQTCDMMLANVDHLITQANLNKDETTKQKCALEQEIYNIKATLKAQIQDSDEQLVTESRDHDKKRTNKKSIRTGFTKYWPKSS